MGFEPTLLNWQSRVITTILYPQKTAETGLEPISLESESSVLTITLFSHSRNPRSRTLIFGFGDQRVTITPGTHIQSAFKKGA